MDRAGAVRCISFLAHIYFIFGVSIPAASVGVWGFLASFYWHIFELINNVSFLLHYLEQENKHQIGYTYACVAGRLSWDPPKQREATRWLLLPTFCIHRYLCRVIPDHLKTRMKVLSSASFS
jgi:hypothetical protein